MSANAEQASRAKAGALRTLRDNVLRYFALLLRKPRVSARRRAPARQVGIPLLLAAAVLAIMFLVDAPAVEIVQKLPLWVKHRFDQITDFGKTSWLLPPIALLLALLALAAPFSTTFSQRVLATIAVRLGFLFWAIALPGLFVTIVKRMIGRARPLVGGSIDPFNYLPFAWTPAYAGLPSGHATDSFGAAVAFGALFPAVRPLLWTYAVLIALSRVVLTAHFPSDVAAGGIVGIAGVLLVRQWFAVRRLAFSIGTDGTIRTLPGPSFRRIRKVVRQLLAS